MIVLTIILTCMAILLGVCLWKLWKIEADYVPMDLLQGILNSIHRCLEECVPMIEDEEGEENIS